MKFLDRKTIWAAMAPMTCANWVFGTRTFEYPVGRPRRAMSLCLSLAHIVFFLSLIRMSNIIESTRINSWSIGVFVYHIYLNITAPIIVAIIVIGQAKSKAAMSCMSRISRVTKTMSKVGILDDYAATMKSQLIVICGSLLFLVTIFTLESMRHGHHRSSVSITVGSMGRMFYVSVITLLVDYTFSDYVRYLGKRFLRLNEYLITFSVVEQKAKPLFQILNYDVVTSDLFRTTVADKTRMMRIVRMSRQLHAELCAIAMEVTSVFGIQILLSFTSAFWIIILLFFNIFNSLVPPEDLDGRTLDIVTMVCWTSFALTKLIVVVSNCVRTSNEARKTGEIIHELVDPTTAIEIKREIHSFSLQLMQNPLQFTANSFFVIDYSFIHTMIGTVTTYFAIMVQMRSIKSSRADEKYASAILGNGTSSSN